MLAELPTAAQADSSTLFRPPAPKPLTKPLSMLGVLRQLRKDPLTTWTQTHFEKPIVVVEGFFGHVAVLSDPAAIRHVLVDNASNYRKDDLQRRILAPTMGNSLFTAEADEWRTQRRALAPLFARKTVSGFGPAMRKRPIGSCGGCSGAVRAARSTWRSR